MGIIHLLCMRRGKFLKISERKATLRASGCLCRLNKVCLHTILMCHLKKKNLCFTLNTVTTCHKDVTATLYYSKATHI